MNRLLSLTALLFICVLSHKLNAQSMNSYEVTKINEYVYVLSYAFSPTDKKNVGLVIGEHGAVLINTMMVSKVDALEKTVSSITSKPIKYVINSNYDWWSTSANKYFADKGATILAHENSIYMSNNYHQLTFADEFTLNLGNEEIYVYKSGGHSYGHINIILKNSDVIWLADSYNQQWPTLLGPSGLKGYSKGLNSVLQFGNAQTKYVTGGSSTIDNMIVTQSSIQKELQVRRLFVERTQLLIGQNKTNDEIAKDLLLNEYLKFYTNPNKFVIENWLIDPIRFFTRLESYPITSDEYETLVGKYQSEDGLIIDVFKFNHQLVARAKGWFMSPLAHLSTNTFMFNRQMLESMITFHIDKEKHISSLVMTHSDDYQGHLTALHGKTFSRVRQ